VSRSQSSLVLALIRASAMLKRRRICRSWRLITKRVKNPNYSATVPLKVGSRMRARDNSVGGNAGRVARIQVGDGALIAAQGRLKP